MGWKNLILLEKILMVESTQMLGLKNEKTTGLIMLYYVRYIMLLDFLHNIGMYCRHTVAYF